MNTKINLFDNLLSCELIGVHDFVVHRNLSEIVLLSLLEIDAVLEEIFASEFVGETHEKACQNRENHSDTH